MELQKAKSVGVLGKGFKPEAEMCLVVKPHPQPAFCLALECILLTTLVTLMAKSVKI